MEESVVLQDRFARALGMEIMTCSQGHARTCVKINENCFNAAGNVHGGFLFTLADFALSVAANTDNRDAVGITINGSIHLSHSVKDGLLIAEAHEISRNKDIGSYCVEITDETSQVLATFQGQALFQTL